MAKAVSGRIYQEPRTTRLGQGYERWRRVAGLALAGSLRSVKLMSSNTCNVYIYICRDICMLFVLHMYVVLFVCVYV